MVSYNWFGSLSDWIQSTSARPVDHFPRVLVDSMTNVYCISCFKFSPLAYNLFLYTYVVFLYDDIFYCFLYLHFKTPLYSTFINETWYIELKATCY